MFFFSALLHCRQVRKIKITAIIRSSAFAVTPNRYDIAGIYTGCTAACTGNWRGWCSKKYNRRNGFGWHDCIFYHFYIYCSGVLYVLFTRFSYGKKQLQWLQDHHEELMEKARKVEEQNIDPELEYEIALAKEELKNENEK